MKTRIFESKWIFYFIVFIFFVVFFSQVHPIAPYDTDDWQNIGLERPPYPSLDCWNPTKVFPECFEPLVATLAGYFVVPLVGDYIFGLILTNAVVVSLFIVFYLLFVHAYIEKRFNLSRLTNFALIIIFILFHFLILRSAGEKNEYLWYSHDTNCYYHYVIPNMMCACMVLWLMQHDLRKIQSGKTISVLIVLTYLALCSNLYSVVILIAYIGAVLVMDMLNTFKADKVWIKDYIIRNAIYLSVVILWLVIQLIEASGIRANGYGFLHEPFLHCMKITVLNFLAIRYNHWFVLITVLFIVGAKLLDFKRNGHGLWELGHQQWVIILSLALSTIYLIMLSSRVEPLYIQRGDVIFEYFFFYLLIVLIAMAYLCAHIKYAVSATPLLIFFLFFQINTVGKTFKDVVEEYEPDLQTCIEIDRDIVRRICDADVAGQDSVVIYVPRYSKHSYNWPMMVTDYASQYYGKALYKHNQTSREIRTIFIPSYVID